jgi:hypothetical protein
MLKAWPSINHAVLSSGSRQCNTISTEIKKADGRRSDLYIKKEQTRRQQEADIPTYVQMWHTDSLKCADKYNANVTFKCKWGKEYGGDWGKAFFCRSPSLFYSLKTTWTIFLSSSTSEIGIFFIFYVLYSTLLHLPPLRFYCADGCWDRTQDRCNFMISTHGSGLQYRYVEFTVCSGLIQT